MTEASLAAITGLRVEARIAERAGWRAAYGGGHFRASERAIERVLGAGATALLSFGIAGGLAPGLRPGTLVMADRVIGDSGDSAPPTCLARDSGRAFNIVLGAVFGATAPVGSALAKRAIFERTGALAVDLESALVAAAASRARLPYAVLRAIADPAERDLPNAALVPLRDSGGPDLPAVLGALLREPGQLLRLCRVALDTRAALGALGRGVRVLEPALTRMAMTGRLIEGPGLDSPV
jgi:adenosylhomocysteine nucleosidase